jgi:alditol oxidase
MKKNPRTNWAGNLTYSTDNLFTPQIIAELQQSIKQCKKVRGIGTKHCFNKTQIACIKNMLKSMKQN